MSAKRRCIVCSGREKISKETIKEIVESNGYSIPSDSSFNFEKMTSKTKFKTICQLGHEYITCYSTFLTGVRCNVCAGQRRWSEDEVIDFLKKEEYQYIRGYDNMKSKIETLCPNKHMYAVLFRSFKDKRSRCVVCSNNGSSNKEGDLFLSILCIYPSAKKHRDREVKIEDKPHIFGFEIDIFVPELKKGIEFDGAYYHSFNFMRKNHKKSKWSDDDIRNYHEIKDSWFLSQGIEIVHIKEEDWDKDKEECIRRCLDFLSKT
jgi:hypothetical protein